MLSERVAVWNSLWLETAGKATITLLLASILALASCGESARSGGETSSSTGTNSALSKVILEVPTIFWVGCWPRVEASAKSVPGVKDVQFDSQRIQTVIVTYDPAQTTADAIVEAIERRGDKVRKVTTVTEPWTGLVTRKPWKAEISQVYHVATW